VEEEDLVGGGNEENAAYMSVRLLSRVGGRIYLALGRGSAIAFLGLDSEDMYCFWRAEGGAIVGNLVRSCAKENISLREVLVDCGLYAGIRHKNLWLLSLNGNSGIFIRGFVLKTSKTIELQSLNNIEAFDVILEFLTQGVTCSLPEPRQNSDASSV